MIITVGTTISVVALDLSQKKWITSVLLTAEVGLVYFLLTYIGEYHFDLFGSILLGAGISFLLVWEQKERRHFTVRKLDQLCNYPNGNELQT